MDTFLYAFDIPKLNQEGINYLNISIKINDIEAVIVSQQRKAHNIMDSLLKST
jgi:hypothetical protein